MSKYTSELRFICESLSGLSESAGGNRVDDIISTARPLIFNFEYPLFDAQYAEVLETKILRHFYTREIGLETYGLWKLKLETKLVEIMPYYNQLYESELIEFNPMYDVNYTRSGSESLSQSESTASSGSTSASDSMSTSELNSTSNSVQGSEWNLYQDTPQNGLTGIDTYNYLTTATNIKNNNNAVGANRRNTVDAEQHLVASTTSGNRQALDTKGYLESIVGYRNDNPSKLLQDYRDTFLNIDMMVIKDLEELFMQLW